MEPRGGRWLSQDDIDIRGETCPPAPSQGSCNFTKMFSSINSTLSTDRLLPIEAVFKNHLRKTQHRYYWFQSSANALASEELQDSWGLGCLWITSHTLLSSVGWIKEWIFQDLSPITLFLQFQISLFWIREASWKQCGQVWRPWSPGPGQLDSSLDPVEYRLGDLGGMAYLTLSGPQCSHLKNAIHLCGWMVVRTVSYEIGKCLGKNEMFIQQLSL